MFGRSTIDVIFLVRRLQEKFRAVKNTLYMAFVDPIMALYRVTHVLTGGLFACLA